MMKLFIKTLTTYLGVFTLAISLWFLTTSQWAVTDAGSTAQLVTVGNTLKQMNETRKELIGDDSFLGNLAKNSVQAKRLFHLLESMVCATDQFEFYMGIVGNHTVCSRRLNIDITFSKIEGISGKLRGIAQLGNAMSKMDGVNTLEMFNDKLEEGIKEVMAINTNLRYDVVKAMDIERIKTEGHKDYLFTKPVKLK